MVKPFNKEKYKEEYNYKKHFLEAVLVSSISDENSWIPTKKEYILSELINGTIDYIGGQAGKITYNNSRFTDDSDIFELNMHKYLMKNIRSHKNMELGLNIEKVLKNLCSSNSVTEHDVELYDFFREICPVQGPSIFSPSYETVLRVRKEILPSLSLQERANIQGIGYKMRQFMDQDMA